MLAYVGLGANLGDPRAQVEQALRDLAELGELRASSLYRSQALGRAGDPDFVNAVAELRTTLSARSLLERMQALERRAGRPSRHPRWAPRTLDLDLLLYGDARIDEPGLVVPHPGLTRRRFVLEPLVELAPLLREPVSGRSLRDWLADLDDPLRVERIPGSVPAPEPGPNP